MHDGGEESALDQKDGWKNWALFWGSLFVVVAVFWIADRTIARALLEAANIRASIFEPYAKHAYFTDEFRLVANINSLGFRDRPVSTTRESQYRILAIGDSFTFGYGVEDDASWPKALERILRDQGIDAEVLNLGKPGCGPRFYAEAARDAVPWLKPDLVLVGLLQGDDLYFTYRGSLEDYDRGARANRPPLVRLVYTLFPNIVDLAYARAYAPQPMPDADDFARTRFNEQRRAARFAASWTMAERERFNALDAEIREAYFDGGVNPFNIRMGVQSNHFFRFSAEDGPEYQARQQDKAVMLSESMASIRRVAEKHGGKAAAVFVPHGAYMTETTQADAARLGIQITPGMRSSTRPDYLLGLACDAGGVPWGEVTSAFRARAESDDLYFPMDLHFNADGHVAFARLIAPFVKAQLGVQ